MEPEWAQFTFRFLGKRFHGIRKDLMASCRCINFISSQHIFRTGQTFMLINKVIRHFVCGGGANTTMKLYVVSVYAHLGFRSKLDNLKSNQSVNLVLVKACHTRYETRKRSSHGKSQSFFRTAHMSAQRASKWTHQVLYEVDVILAPSKIYRADVIVDSPND